MPDLDADENLTSEDPGATQTATENTARAEEARYADEPLCACRLLTLVCPEWAIEACYVTWLKPANPVLGGERYWLPYRAEG